MSWEQSYSFGNPNAQPPTPTRTPISAAFPSPGFQTPRASHTFENRSGWTPTFAEEYSVFNQTPGRLTSAQVPFLETSTSRSSTPSSRHQSLSSQGELEAEVAAHVRHFSTQSDHPLFHEDQSRQLSSSPGAVPPYGGSFNDETIKVTPRKPRRRLEEAFSGQTATPPQTARRLAPKFDMDGMQRNQESYGSATGTPGHHNHLSFASINQEDMFAYPMSAPATAPVFTNARPFWDSDNSMGNMHMNFSNADAPLFDTSSTHRLANSFDWGRSNQNFQETSNAQIFNQGFSQSNKSERALHAKIPVPQGQNSSGLSFDFSMATMSDDPFAMVASTGAVDPGLLFTIPEPPSASSIARPASSESIHSRPASCGVIREPYQHQQRESRRDQEELRRSRSTKDMADANRYDRVAFSSPGKGSRPGLRRSMSDGRSKRLQLNKPPPLSTTGLRTSAPNARTVSRGRLSPSKLHNSASLASIPETGLGGRVTFTIDSNGRARTDVVVDEQKTTPGGPQLTPSECDSPHSVSSSDDEPIIIPSRRPSSSTLSESRNGAKLPQFQISHQHIERRRKSSSAAYPSSVTDQDSEAETEIGFDRSGDAADALRKMMENRRGSSSMRGAVTRNQFSRDTNQLFGQSTPQHRQHYLNQANSARSSYTGHPDMGTPSTDRESSISDSTRCVCNTTEGGFMIQCESCDKWLHGDCVGIDRRRLPQVFICAFCAQTPNMRGGRVRESARGSAQHVGSSPLAHKSFQSWR